MATLSNKWKLAASNRENQEDYPKSKLAQNEKVPFSQEIYMTQFSEEIEDGQTKKMSQEFSRTENWVALPNWWVLIEPAISRPYRNSCNFFRKTKGGALQMSATTPQWNDPCVKGPNFVGPSTVGQRKQLRQLQIWHQLTF